MIRECYMIYDCVNDKQIGNAHGCPYIEKEAALIKMEKLTNANPKSIYVLQKFSINHIGIEPMSMREIETMPISIGKEQINEWLDLIRTAIKYSLFNKEN